MTVRLYNIVKRDDKHVGQLICTVYYTRSCVFEAILTRDCYLMNVYGLSFDFSKESRARVVLYSYIVYKYIFCNILLESPTTRYQSLIFFRPRASTPSPV